MAQHAAHCIAVKTQAHCGVPAIVQVVAPLTNAARRRAGSGAGLSGHQAAGVTTHCSTQGSCRVPLLMRAHQRLQEGLRAGAAVPGRQGAGSPALLKNHSLAGVCAAAAEAGVDS